MKNKNKEHQEESKGLRDLYPTKELHQKGLQSERSVDPLFFIYTLQTNYIKNTPQVDPYFSQSSMKAKTKKYFFFLFFYW